MEAIFEAYLNRFKELHRGIDATLEGLPSQALDWSPGEGLNSISVLIIHLIGAERYWIGDVACSLPSNRDRAAEFRAQRWELEALSKRLRDTLDFTKMALNQLTLDDLSKDRLSPMRGDQVTVAWAILHALEHTAIHLGHLQITRQWWERDHISREEA